MDKLVSCPFLALGAQANDKARASCPPEAMVAAINDPLHVCPSTMLKKAHKQQVWLMLNERSVRDRKKIVRGASYSQQMSLTLMSEKVLASVLPEKERLNYAGFTTGDVIGFITCMSSEKLWRLPRTGS